MHLVHKYVSALTHNSATKRTTAAAWLATRWNLLLEANRECVECVKWIAFGSTAKRKLDFVTNYKTLQFQEVARWLRANSSLSRLQSRCRWNTRTSLIPSFSLFLCSVSLIFRSPSLAARSVKKKLPLVVLCAAQPFPKTHTPPTICDENDKLRQKFFFLKIVNSPHIFPLIVSSTSVFSSSCLHRLPPSCPALVLCLATLAGDQTQPTVWFVPAFVELEQSVTHVLFYMWWAGFWGLYKPQLKKSFIPQRGWRRRSLPSVRASSTLRSCSLLEDMTGLSASSV